LGIGLAIVKSLVEMHGGTVAVTSEGIGKGARFTILLPLRPAAVQLETAPTAPVSVLEEVPDVSGVRLEGVKVLVVDDDPDARRVMTRLLKDFGATVADADSVARAMGMIGSFGPDVLVSDIGMPGQDGYDLMKQLRGSEGTDGARLPAIALTAFAGEDNRKRAIKGGFQTHLAKPVNPAALVMEIAKLAGR
jgi:CheY-like chemotaxis protein